ncbi:MAG: amidase [Tenericutes bacterium HGW-Tenericutes-3]|nr:MAG: amidase [Tenericutes bacterium HGW-Tenericutes-3]
MKEYTLRELIDGLNKGSWSSVDLVNMYLDQIKKYDGYLNSVAEVNPDALKIAKALDQEKKEKGPRSLLHGIPILIKDNINTHDEMHTTASSESLSDLKAPYDATIIKKLRDAGAIILGKTNLSEFAYFMSYDKMPSGYGSRNGQVINPYHKDIDPLGSSTGSAVAVAANLICISIGTETNGSLMAPAYKNSIVSIKPTFGLVSRYGIIPISETQDTAGPMARNVADCAILLDFLVGTDTNDSYTKHADSHKQDLKNAYLKSSKGKKAGVLYFSNFAYSEEENAILEDSIIKLKAEGLHVEKITIESHPMKNDESLLYEFKNNLNAYLKTVSSNTKMKSLADIIQFNLENPEKRLKYGQSILVASEKTSGDLNDPVYLEIRKKLLSEANRLQSIMEEKALDCLISTKWTSYAPIAGNPSICVPAKALTDLVPRSLVFVGKKFDDQTLISIAHCYEQATQYRIPPTLMP